MAHPYEKLARPERASRSVAYLHPWSASRLRSADALGSPRPKVRPGPPRLRYARGAGYLHGRRQLAGKGEGCSLSKEIAVEGELSALAQGSSL